MKIFLDVGAHEGETLPAVLDPRFGFDRIVCFEPASGCWPRLRRIRDPRVSIEPFGLWRASTTMTMHDPGDIGASIFEKKYSTGRRTEQVKLVKASEWFADNLGHEDEIYAKLNVEGAEADILEDLITTGEIKKLDALLVHLDIRKVPSQRDRADQVVRDVAEAGIPFTVGDHRTGPSHIARVQSWLEQAGAAGSMTGPMAHLRSAVLRLRYVAIPTLSRSFRLGTLVRAVFGKRLHRLIRSRVLGYRFEERKIRTKPN